MKHKPLLAITMGDPGGVGPEVVLKALARAAVRDSCRPVIVGDFRVLAKCLRFAGGALRLAPIPGTASLPSASPAVPVVTPCRTVARHRWGAVRGDYGAAAMECVRYAAREAMAGRVDGIVTAPICKESIRLAGYRCRGHTDYLARLTGSRRHAMMLAGGGLRVVLVTIHVPLAGVSRLISREAVLRTILLARDACMRLGVKKPRIAVCGLNPHAGEGGAFGREEGALILPAIRAAVRRGVAARGPFPSDTLFVPRFRESFDAIVAMYHDQGLIPLKMLAFDTGVNVTLGLPIVRTSPDHGTAFDIAGRGSADPGSMAAAIELASEMCLRAKRRA